MLIMLMHLLTLNCYVQCGTYMDPAVISIPSSFACRMALPCTQDEHCSKKYPKQFISDTQLGADSYIPNIQEEYP